MLELVRWDAGPRKRSLLRSERGSPSSFLSICHSYGVNERFMVAPYSNREWRQEKIRNFDTGSNSLRP